MVRSQHLEAYRTLVDDATLDEVYRLAEPLRGRTVLHINTTANGGGVAGMLQMILPALNDLGIQHLWEVVQLDQDACHFMARLSDMLQGGDPGAITTDEHVTFLETVARAAAPLADIRADAYYVHDIQIAPLGQLLPQLRPACWFCHIDTALPNPHAAQYLRQFLGAYDLCTFNTPASVQPVMPDGRTSVMTLGIDPFITKHAPLPSDEGQALIERCGVDAQRPLIAQVSRFGRWKNPWQAIDIYRLIKRQLPEAQLALVGAMQAIDDVKALEVFHDLRDYAGGDRDIHLLADPALIDNRTVNAFQRYAGVILQRSSREGFGFTVTEAMWKGQPVVGTGATGLRYQISHGENGYIADDSAEAAAYSLGLLRHPDQRRAMGQRAHAAVARRFLLPAMLRDYLRDLARMLAAP